MTNFYGFINFMIYILVAISTLSLFRVCNCIFNCIFLRCVVNKGYSNGRESMNLCMYMMQLCQWVVMISNLLWCLYSSCFACMLCNSNMHVGVTHVCVSHRVVFDNKIQITVHIDTIIWIHGNGYINDTKYLGCKACNVSMCSWLFLKIQETRMQ